MHLRSASVAKCGTQKVGMQGPDGNAHMMVKVGLELGAEQSHVSQYGKCAYAATMFLPPGPWGTLIPRTKNNGSYFAVGRELQAGATTRGSVVQPLHQPRCATLSG